MAAQNRTIVYHAVAPSGRRCVGRSPHATSCSVRRGLGSWTKPQRMVQLGHWDRASRDPHIASGDPPIRRRVFRIGDEDVEIPLLSVEQLRDIASMMHPATAMSVNNKLDARIKIIGAVWHSHIRILPPTILKTI
jgi:hypothetical protein